MTLRENQLILVFLSPFNLRKSSISPVRISMIQFLKTVPLESLSLNRTHKAGIMASRGCSMDFSHTILLNPHTIKGGRDYYEA